jgi:hypothetical protein
LGSEMLHTREVPYVVCVFFSFFRLCFFSCACSLLSVCTSICPLPFQSMCFLRADADWLACTYLLNVDLLSSHDDTLLPSARAFFVADTWMSGLCRQAVIGHCTVVELYFLKAYDPPLPPPPHTHTSHHTTPHITHHHHHHHPPPTATHHRPLPPPSPHPPTHPPTHPCTHLKPHTQPHRQTANTTTEHHHLSSSFSSQSFFCVVVNRWSA